MPHFSGVCEYGLIDPQRHQAEFYLRRRWYLLLGTYQRGWYFSQHRAACFVAKSGLALERINAASSGGFKGMAISSVCVSFAQELIKIFRSKIPSFKVEIQIGYDPSLQI